MILKTKLLLLSRQRIVGTELLYWNVQFLIILILYSIKINLVCSKRLKSFFIYCQTCMSNYWIDFIAHFYFRDNYHIWINQSNSYTSDVYSRKEISKFFQTWFLHFLLNRFVCLPQDLFSLLIRMWGLSIKDGLQKTIRMLKVYIIRKLRLTNTISEVKPVKFWRKQMV